MCADKPDIMRHAQRVVVAEVEFRKRVGHLRRADLAHVVGRLAAYELVRVVGAVLQDLFVVSVRIVGEQVEALEAEHIFAGLLPCPEKERAHVLVAQREEFMERESPDVAGVFLSGVFQPVAAACVSKVRTDRALRCRETERRVAEYVGFEDIDLLHPFPDPVALREHSEKVGRRLVLKDIHGVAYADERLAAGEDVARGYAVVLPEIPIVAGVEYGHAHVRGGFRDVVEHYSRSRVIERVFDGKLRVCPVIDPFTGEAISPDNLSLDLFRVLPPFDRAPYLLPDAVSRVLVVAVHLVRVRRVRDILPFRNPVLVENREVEFVARDFLEENVLHVRIHREDIELRPVRACECLGNLLVKGYGLVLPRREAVRERAAPAVRHQVVEPVPLRLGSGRLEQVARDFPVLVAPFFRRLDAAGVDVAADVLRRVGGEGVVEEVCLHAVAPEASELEIKVVVEPVRRH